MSVKVYRFLECNGRTGCMTDTTRFDSDGALESSETNEILRGQVKKDGWHSTGDYDLCPTCYDSFFGEKQCV